MRNELSHVMVKLQNVKIEPSSVRKTVTCDVGIVKCEKKKVREPPNETKELLYVILELHNMRMKPSNVRKKVRESPNVPHNRGE